MRRTVPGWVLAVAVVLAAMATAVTCMLSASEPDSTGMSEACAEVVRAADQALIGAGQIVDDKNSSRYTNPLTAANFDAQLAGIRRRYDAARAECPVP